MTPTGFELSAETQGKTAVLEFGGATGGAVGGESGHFDADLAAVVNAWPALPESVKAGILAMVEAAS